MPLPIAGIIARFGIDAGLTALLEMLLNKGGRQVLKKAGAKLIGKKLAPLGKEGASAIGRALTTGAAIGGGNSLLLQAHEYGINKRASLADQLGNEKLMQVLEAVQAVNAQQQKPQTVLDYNKLSFFPQSGGGGGYPQGGY